MGDRVDINALKRRQAQEDQMNRIGAFGGGKNLARQVGRPMPLRTKEEEEMARKREMQKKDSMKTYME